MAATEETVSSRPDFGSTAQLGRRRSSLGKIVPVFVVVGLIAAGAFAWPKLQSLGSSQSESDAMTHTVARETLVLTVTEDGNVESAKNVDVKCEVAGGGTILWIVPDGEEVVAGQEIVRLDESAIEEQLNLQKITYEQALAAKIQAEQNFEAAEIAVQEYAEGTYEVELQTLESQVVIAMENLRSAENMLEHSQKMNRKGFVTPLQLEADEFAVERANLDLDAAKTAKEVLEKFTKRKMLKELESLRDSAEAQLRAQQASLELEKGRLERLQKQLENCVVTAPQNGMVVYANNTSRRSSEPQIEEGALVRERQTIVRIPDLSDMQVKVTVHESKVDQLRPGMPARIVVQDSELSGHVTSVANQPEAGGWMSTGVKEYGTIVQIDGESTGLRPGMTAEVEILIARHEDVLTVPVQAVVEQRGEYFVWVQKPDGPERRVVLLGPTNDKMIAIEDGLVEGDKVLLNPRAVVAEARETDSDEDSDAGPKSRFDDVEALPAEKPEEKPAPAGGSGPGAAGGRSRNLMQYDKDGDKKISREEAPEFMASFFDRIDANSDGTLDAAELAKARAQRPPEGGAAGRPGAGGGARP